MALSSEFLNKNCNNVSGFVSFLNANVVPDNPCPSAMFIFEHATDELSVAALNSFELDARTLSTLFVEFPHRVIVILIIKKTTSVSLDEVFRHLDSEGLSIAIEKLFDHAMDQQQHGNERDQQSVVGAINEDPVIRATQKSYGRELIRSYLDCTNDYKGVFEAIKNFDPKIKETLMEKVTQEQAVQCFCSATMKEEDKYI